MTKPRLPTLICEVTRACNHACPFCYNYWNHPREAGASAAEAPDWPGLLEHVLDQVECRHITLTGGEPCLRPDLPEIVSFLSRRRLGSTIISNGRLLTDALAGDLVGRGAGLFELPLLSWRRQVHDRLSGAAGAFDAAVSALASIRHHGGRAVVVVVVTRENLTDLYDTIQLAFGFGALGIMPNRFNPGGRGVSHLDELMPTAAELAQALAVAERAGLEFQLPVACSIPIPPCLIDTTRYPHVGFGFCAAGSERAYYALDSWGNIRPCNHSPTILGNVWQQRMLDLMASSQLQEFVAAAPVFCAGCPWLSRCQGGCKAAAQACYGSLWAEEPFLRRNLVFADKPATLRLASTLLNPAASSDETKRRQQAIAIT